MSNELRVTTTPSSNCYFLLWSNQSQIYNTSTGLFEAYQTANYADYDIAATELGTASGVYTGTMPGVAEGLYSIDARLRSGASPAQTDQLVGSNVLVWNGSAFNVTTYQAKVTLTIDVSDSEDFYLVVFYKNAQPFVTAASITNPRLQVYATSGNDLIAVTALTQIGSTGTYKYVAESDERVTAGLAYIAKITATIESVAVSWYQPVSRSQ